MGTTIRLRQTVESFPRWLGESLFKVIDFRVKRLARSELGKAERTRVFYSIFGIQIHELAGVFSDRCHAQAFENSTKPLIEIVELGQHVVLTAFQVSEQ